MVGADVLAAAMEKVTGPSDCGQGRGGGGGGTYVLLALVHSFDH